MKKFSKGDKVQWDAAPGGPIVLGSIVGGPWKTQGRILYQIMPESRGFVSWMPWRDLSLREEGIEPRSNEATTEGNDGDG